MTRRLEPEERIKELGDASVPFEFDIHAMIHSDNAPEHESNLHRRFEDMKINLINNRKEFFRVSMDELEKVVREFKADIVLTKVAEAREYHESKAMREQRSKQPSSVEQPVPMASKFPDNL